ncbi:hypothetical protein C8Q73DRAFT_145550 [Cubamyces lactineus]|nr:hypothetical protein C8Q73DRAFT_145550 [Cubamyces lactineus]
MLNLIRNLSCGLLPCGTTSDNHGYGFDRNRLAASQSPYVQSLSISNTSTGDDTAITRPDRVAISDTHNSFILASSRNLFGSSSHDSNRMAPFKEMERPSIYPAVGQGSRGDVRGKNRVRDASAEVQNWAHTAALMPNRRNSTNHVSACYRQRQNHSTPPLSVQSVALMTNYPQMLFVPRLKPIDTASPVETFAGGPGCSNSSGWYSSRNPIALPVESVS